MLVLCRGMVMDMYLGWMPTSQDEENVLLPPTLRSTAWLLYSMNRFIQKTPFLHFPHFLHLLHLLFHLVLLVRTLTIGFLWISDVIRSLSSSPVQLSLVMELNCTASP